MLQEKAVQETARSKVLLSLKITIIKKTTRIASSSSIHKHPDIQKLFQTLWKATSFTVLHSTEVLKKDAVMAVNTKGSEPWVTDHLHH